MTPGRAVLPCLLLLACAGGDDDDFGRAGEPDEPTPRDGTLDLSGLPDGRVGVPYAGRVAVADYDGPVDMSAGELPDGLTMTSGGSISGTPTRYGTDEFRVLAAGMDGVRDFTEVVVLRTLPAEADAPFLGMDRSYVNNLLAEEGLLRDPAIRVSGGGEQGGQVFVIRPGIYDGGPDGANTGGFGDDVLIAELAPSEVTVEVSEFEYGRTADPRPPSYPSGHYNEWDPPEFDPDTATFTAGSDTGTARVTVRHRQYGELRFELVVVGPDWCPGGTRLICE